MYRIILNIELILNQYSYEIIFLFIDVEIKDLLTVVIPCKNEGFRIKEILEDLNSQYYIKGLKVYVADSSDDLSTRLYIDSQTSGLCDIQVIEGGLPSVARKNGGDKVITPYVLFLDADMRLPHKTFISSILNEIMEKRGGLLTTRVRTTDGKYDYVYKVFDIIQKLHRITGPFALGGIMLFNTTTYNNLGGFNTEDVIAEDYNLSRKVPSRHFILSNKTILTDGRRFRNKGVWYMLKLMIKTYINKNNKNYYKDSQSYWS